jgi:hypothetical protein
MTQEYAGKMQENTKHTNRQTYVQTNLERQTDMQTLGQA